MDLGKDPGSHVRSVGVSWMGRWCVAAGLLAAWVVVLAAAPGRERGGARFIPLTLGTTRLLAEVADTPEKQALGLMFRQKIPGDYAMIFPYPDEDIRTFWMKNCRVSLDLIFVNRQHQIVGITHRAPPCREDPCPVYSSPSPAMFVIEVAGGRATELGLREGDRVGFSNP